MADMAEKAVIANVAAACEGLGEEELAGISLESADPRLLDVTLMDLDRHVAMQPSAMAYYGSLLKDAGRRLAAFKRHCDRWEKVKMAEARVSVENGTSAPSKITASDVEARFIVDNQAEIEKRESQLAKLQMENDTLSVWFEAWRQKSFSIREHANITEEERWNTNPSRSVSEKSNNRSGSLDRVRGIISKRRQSS